ncbi:hypothetical protein F4V57_11045 [Acinetobacter qingfengensis]|uniref:Uncharacterized protein n=1 Tax=Acinetobacter qingfengensis TaxID=1262585 RepID=A0A1E7RDC6_9GAMM|nr:hypothetical protein [Acinetobacter qingfengensis]KAA8732148.1 hypothetical protein F4V57_11045 [Acinetobacter qingfengensis]OEY97227.1 hypothetical protein BJI46_02030 [Acinetobacter qingfengensis]
MSHPDPDRELQQALEKRQKNIHELNRILWVVLPTLALLISMIVANYNIWSTLFSFIVLSTAFILVGIKQKNLSLVLVLTLIYCLIDNYLSYQYQLNSSGLKRQLLMLLFITIIGLGRNFADRAMLNKT